MFGGGTNYVNTLNAILHYVDEQHPTTDELVGWHRGSFANVSSRESPGPDVFVVYNWYWSSKA
ncbi:hypothetical protein JCM18750_31590 [Halostagnicola bangensis]